MTTLSPPTITKRPVGHTGESNNGYNHSLNRIHPPLQREITKVRRYVSKEEYWAKYYESEENYEWNNGYLEERPMSTRAQSYLMQWFLGVLRQYIETHEGHDLMIIDVGFEMTVPDPDQPGEMKEVVRKPDLAVVTPDNAVRWEEGERSYHGLCDLCIESLSDSDKAEKERDTKFKGSSKRNVQTDVLSQQNIAFARFRLMSEFKKAEYEFAGVKEYYILDPSDKEMHFYQRTSAGKYQEIQPDAEGVIHSQVLKGFQFRKRDLKEQPTLEEMALDPVYQNYVLLRYQTANQRAERAEQHAKQEAQRAEYERQEKEKYATLLRAMGVQID